jgi:hypothetical protein
MDLWSKYRANKRNMEIEKYPFFDSRTAGTAFQRLTARPVGQGLTESAAKTGIISGDWPQTARVSGRHRS